MYRRIVVAVAKTATAERAVEVAADLAQRYGAELHLVTAVDKGAGPDSPARRGAEAYLESLAPVGAHTHVVPGAPAEVILLVAEERKADLVVVGNVGMHRRVLGSVPNDIAHGASCSVLIVDTV